MFKFIKNLEFIPISFKNGITKVAGMKSNGFCRYVGYYKEKNIPVKLHRIFNEDHSYTTYNYDEEGNLISIDEHNLIQEKFCKEDLINQLRKLKSKYNIISKKDTEYIKDKLYNVEKIMIRDNNRHLIYSGCFIGDIPVLGHRFYNKNECTKYVFDINGNYIGGAINT
jgi:YD repeat-containing protein